jgi:putative tryptophan/tyrosine transport system substrate-binding protein
MFDVRRREIITMLGAAAAAWPVVARAQQTAMPVVGVLNVGTPTGLAHLMQAFHQGLAETSYVEGRNLSIQYRWAGSRNDRFPGLAAELVRSKVTVIVSLGGLPSAQAAKAATSTIPVAFYTGADPVQFGLVDSLSRPGGNSTGVTTLTAEVAPKRLELLHEVVPAARDVAALINPTNPAAESLAKDIRVAAQTFGLKVKILHASTESELNAVFSDLIKVPPGGLVIGSDPFFNTTSELLATVTAATRCLLFINTTSLSPLEDS